jgi:hypothetical protein
MKQTNTTSFVFAFLLVLSFASAISSEVPLFISPTPNSYVFGGDVFFNVSVPSNIVGMNYLGGFLCNTDADGYCSFTMSYTNFNNNALNNITFDFLAEDEEDDFSYSVSFYYNVDIVAPNITLNGSSVINMTVGSLYAELGATANDDVSGDLTVNITIDNSSLDVNTVGTYNITYFVTDDAGNSASVNRTVIVSAAPVAPTNDGSSGGGSCNTQWTCGEWSACNSGSQTRTCSYPSSYCTPRSDKPTELRTCTLSSPVNQTDLTDLNNQTQAPTFVNRLTGAVIGTAAGRWSLGILLFLIIVGLAYWIVAKKRKASAKAKQKPSKKSKK